MSTLHAAYWGERALGAVNDKLPDLAYDHARIAAHLSGLTEAAHREQIAQILSDAAHIEVGAEPRALCDLTIPMRERFMGEATRALARSRNPLGQTDRDLADRSVDDVEEWMNGPYTGRVPTTREIARLAIHYYQQHERNGL